MSVKQKQSLHFRLMILGRRESRVCLQTYSQHRSRYGWILRCGDDSVLFKDHASKCPETIELDDIKHCGCTDIE